MSIVYRARDEQLKREVAVKVLHGFLARQDEARRRFHREAVAVAKLRHPSILEIYDYSGPDTDEAYIVTELIEGETLRDRVQRSGVPPHPELGALVCFELVGALRHAHEQGVIHRDLKPENVMITRAGQLKLMDFGIAQIMEGGTKLTTTGTLLGSPAHMAPELIDGKRSDHRADIFSLGTILYWLCTGHLPFEAPNPSALFRRILEGRYDPPQMIEPKIGNGLARIITRVLAPDPEARYQDVSELQTDLEGELAEVGLLPSRAHVTALLTDEESFVHEFTPTLIDRLVRRGKEALEARRVARATDLFNRVLAVDPHHEEVAALVSQIGQRAALGRQLRRLGIFAAAAACLAFLGTAVPDVVNPRPPVDTIDEQPTSSWIDPRYAQPKVDPDEGKREAGIPPADQDPPRALDTSETSPPPAPLGKDADPHQPPPPPPALQTSARGARPIVRAPPRDREGIGATRGPETATAPAPEEPPREPLSTAASTKDPPAPAPRAQLTIVISAVAHIKVDGQVRFRDTLKNTVTLSEGRHELVVFRADGTHRPRIVEVDARGTVFEITPEGRRVQVNGELRFRIPRPGSESTVPGWQPATQARAPSP